MEKVIVAAYAKYCVSNPLHPDVFPAIRKMEAEIVAMTLKLFNNPNGAGTMTSGGTESIIMSVKTHRDWARAVKGITEPEMFGFSLWLFLLEIMAYAVLFRRPDMQRLTRVPPTSRLRFTASQSIQSLERSI
jgi:hypothetical protein